MRKLIPVILILLTLTVLVAGASQKGGLPDLSELVANLQESLEDLIQRVTTLENTCSSCSGLEHRIIELESTVDELNQENQQLRNDLDNLLDLPVAEGVTQDGELGEITIVRRGDQTLGEALDDEIPIEIVALSLVSVEPIQVTLDEVNCNIGLGVFGEDRSPNSTGITGIYNHSRNISTVNQFQNWTSVSRGNMSCVPSASGSAIEFWNRTLPGLDNGHNLFNITDNLHRFMNTSETTGTSVPGFYRGITDWINQSGYAKNMSITIRGGFVAGGGSGLVNGVNVTGIPGTGDDFNPTNITMVLDEFVNKNEFTMLVMEVSFGLHAVAIHSISSTPNSNGNYDVALMDPSSGQIIETEIEPNGDICVRYEAGICREVRPTIGIFSISIIGDGIDTDVGDIGAGSD